MDGKTCNIAMQLVLQQCLQNKLHVLGARFYVPFMKLALKMFAVNKPYSSFFHKRCINEESNCLDGNFKVIKNCTRFSPTVCSGCADENYFDSSVGLEGGCVPCSPPCGVYEVETRQCTNEHDRLCTKQWTTNKLQVPSK